MSALGSSVNKSKDDTGSSLKISSSKRLPTEYKQAVEELLALPERLEVWVNERRFKEAVAAILKAREILGRDKILEQAAEAMGIKAEMEDRVTDLAEALCSYLSNSALGEAETRRIIALLLQLDRREQARRIFLESRTAHLQREVSQLKFEGDVPKHVEATCRLLFTSIGLTCRDFCKAFQDASLTSGLVVWAMGEVRGLAERLRQQVFSSDDFATMARCLEVAKLHCVLIEDYGVSLGFFLANLIHQDLVRAIQDHSDRLQTSISKQVGEDAWQSRSQWVLLGTNPVKDTDRQGDDEEEEEEEISGTVILTEECSISVQQSAAILTGCRSGVNTSAVA